MPRVEKTPDEYQKRCNNPQHYPPTADTVTHVYGSVWECPMCHKRSVIQPSHTTDNNWLSQQALQNLTGENP